MTLIRKDLRLLIISIFAALLVGFGLARLLEEPPPQLPHGHLKNDGHARGDHLDDHSSEDGRGLGDNGIIALTTRQIEASGITVVAVGRGGGQETRLTGWVEPTIGARAAVATTVAGRVEQVEVAPGDPVEAGQVLVVLLSGEAAMLRAQADATAAEAETARLIYQRDLNLVEQGVVARQELETSRARSLAADAVARAAQVQLAAAGTPDAEGRVTIVSPLTGTAGMTRVMPGSFVTPGSVVAEVSDPARAELVFTAPPALASRVTAGTPMNVSGPSESFEAVVLGVTVDVRERSGATLVRARPVSATLPPAGSTVTGTLITDRQNDGLTVPADAVQTVDGQTVVFVAIDGGFRVTPVLAGRRAGGQIEILSGLSGSERIAGANAFLLKAELAKGEAEHAH